MSPSSGLLIVNARVHTLDSAAPLASAVAIRCGRILFVGDEPGARQALGMPRKSAGPARAVEVLDCRGACVLPGLVDSHVHFKWYAESLLEVDARSRTLLGAVERVRERVAALPPGAWVKGTGWDHNGWERQPSKEDLDRVSPRNPVVIEARSGHALWVSSRALGAAGIKAGVADPAGGRIDRTASGEPTGILYENARNLVLEVVPKPGVEETAKAMRAAQERALQVGLTGICDFDSPLALRAFELLEERAHLALRVLKGVAREQLGEAIALGLRSGIGSERLRIGQVKLFADGALGTRTAWMLAPFEGTEDRGIAAMSPEELRAEILRASEAGLACAVHAIGDAANRAAVDAFQAASSASAGLSSPASGPGTAAAPRLPHRIEHAQLLHPDDLPRLERLGIVASMQPIHATSDMEMAERWWGTRCATAYPWRSLLESGATLAFGSDCPVETLSPLAGIHAAVTRRRADGSPGLSGWFPGQRLSVEEAVRAYTLGSARTAGLQDERGSISRGKLADFTVLDEDIFSIDPHEIKDVGVRATIVGGALRYLRN